MAHNSPRMCSTMKHAVVQAYEHRRMRTGRGGCRGRALERGARELVEGALLGRELQVEHLGVRRRLEPPRRPLLTPLLPLL